MADLKLSNINKIYSGGVHAVQNFNMVIKHGEFVVFVGPSGCGKSTMLRMIAGLETITEGDMILGDKRINDVAPADRDIAMVFQNYALFGNLTVYENIGFPLTIKHMNGDEIHEKIMEATRVVELKPELNRKPKHLSGGQRQRVAIGRSLVRDPEVFLMDEPLSNLDAKLRVQTRKELSQLHDRLGTTFIYVTHDQVEAMTIADRIVVMENGVVQQMGTPSEIYQTPANVFVGGFIGSPPMNFIKGEVKNGEFHSEMFKLPLASSQQELLGSHNGKEVIVGIRPEHFSLVHNGKEGIKARVDVVEFLGCEYVILFDVNGQLYRARIAENYLDLKTGDEITLYPDMDSVCFFDAESELRIKK